MLAKLILFISSMTYRKFKADYLFTGSTMAAPNNVLVTSEDGRVDAILPDTEAGGDIEYLPGILSPGFVNCHCHMELSHMKGILPEKTGLVDFLLSVMKHRNAQVSSATGTTTGQLAEHIRSAISEAEETMLHNGIVAVGDICNTTDTLPQKTDGRLYYHNFIETMGFIEQRAPDRFAHSLKTFQAFAEAYTLPVGANSIVPHAPYSVSPRLFDMIADFPGNHILTIHNQETEAENEFYRNGKGDFIRLYEAMGLDVSFFTGTGKRSPESYLPHFYRNQTLILVHNVAITEEDLQFTINWRGKGPSDSKAADHPNLFYCLCPNANLYISGQLPDLDLFIRHDLPIVIGTDSLASNHQLSVLEELKTLQRKFPHLSTTTLLQWATLNGAKALQMDSVLGSFSPGKQPGVLLIEDLEGRNLKNESSVRRLI
jgi:aminodeoxyfutalosine deaminase